MTYGVIHITPVWGNTYYSRIHNLVLLQKRVIRIIGNAGYRDHTSSIFHKFKILKLKDLIKLQTCILMYKANNGSLPSHIQLNFVKNKEVHKYNTRQKNDFFCPQVYTKLRKMSVNRYGIDVWNDLPTYIKDCKSISKFKKGIKLLLLNNY